MDSSPLVNSNRRDLRNTPTVRSSGPRKRRRLCGAEVANQVMLSPYSSTPPSHFSVQNSRRMYQPNQSLYDGPYEHDFSEDSDVGQENDPHISNLGLSGPEIVKMIQEQQHLLHQVLETQKLMQTKQDEFDSKLKELVKVSDSASSSPNSSQGKTFRIKRSLTRLVTKLYDSLEGGGFRESEGSTSTFNASIKKKLIDDICASPNCKNSREEVKAAVQRKYESVRRQWRLEDRDDFEEASRQQLTLKRYRARRKRKFENRAVVVRPSEMEYWENLTVDEMSEESDDPSDPNTLIVHKLPWCSQELRQFLATLDARYQEKTKKEGILVARKNRRHGADSQRKPREDLPEWAMDLNWKQGNSNSAEEE